MTGPLARAALRWRRPRKPGRLARLIGRHQIETALARVQALDEARERGEADDWMRIIRAAAGDDERSA